MVGSVEAEMLASGGTGQTGSIEQPHFLEFGTQLYGLLRLIDVLQSLKIFGGF